MWNINCINNFKLCPLKRQSYFFLKGEWYMERSTIKLEVSLINKIKEIQALNGYKVCLLQKDAIKLWQINSIIKKNKNKICF